jgi:4-amino-4-deoxy-L-arabinose transferase-like glycosyltransferase
MDPPVTKHRERWVLLALCMLAFALRVSGLGFQSLWRDEVDAIRFATQPLAGLLGMFTAPGENGPLYYLLLRPWLTQAGQSEFALRFFSLFPGVLAVPLIYRLARRLFPSLRSVALMGAVLATTSAYLIWYSQEGKMYALVVVLALLSMNCLLAALQKGGWLRWLTYVLATIAIFYVHLAAVLLIPVQVVTFLLQDRELQRVRWRTWLVALAFLALPYVPILAWQSHLLLEPTQTGFRFVPLPQMVLSLLGTYSLGVAQGPGAWLAVPSLTALLASAVLWLEDRSQSTPLGILLCWFLLPAMLLFLVTLTYPLYTARYLIYVLPAYLLLISAGIVAIGRRAPALAAVLLIALMLVNARGAWRQARVPVKSDFRAAASYVAGHASADDLLLFQMPYGRHTFDYYARQPLAARNRSSKWPTQTSPAPGRTRHRAYIPLMAAAEVDPYRWAEGLYTNAGMESAEVARRMGELTAGSRVVWLVSTEPDLWDRRGLVQGWLTEHAQLTDEVQFVRVSIFRFELGGGP